MLGAIFFLLSLSAGYSLIAWCAPKWSLLLRLSAGAVVGITLTAWLALLLSIILGFGVGLPLTAGICLVTTLLARRVWKTKIIRGNYWAWIAALTVILPALYLYGTHTLSIHPDGWYVPGYTWGDLPFHMGIISAVAYQPNVPLYLPIFYQVPLTYPFLVDFYSGVLLRLGAGWQFSIFLPSIALFLSGAYLSFATVKSILSAKTAYLHLMLFMLAGSAAGTIAFYNQYLTLGHQAITAFDYTNIAAQGLDFANPITSHFLPQRSFLIGFAIAMFIFFTLSQYLAHKVEGKMLILAGIITGLLPFAHVHTFFVVFAVWLVLTAIFLIQRERIKPEWWYAVLFSFIFALPQLYIQFHFNYTSSFGYWYLGWMRAPGESMLHFWWRNIGLVLPLLAVTPWIIPKIKNRLALAFYIVAIGIAIAINIRIFQPNDWDNMKFILYSYWMFLIPIVWVLQWWWKHRFPYLTVCVVFTMTFPGFLALVREMSSDTDYQLFTNTELTVANDLKTVLPINAKVLTMSEHDNIVPTLTGRRILTGYGGWLWTYGINYLPEEADRQLILDGSEQSAAIIQKYGLTDLVLSDDEITQYGISLDLLRSEYPEIYDLHGWHVFALDCNSTQNPGACLTTGSGF